MTENIGNFDKNHTNLGSNLATSKKNPDNYKHRKKTQKIIDKIKMWQEFEYVRPLICRQTNEKLVPRVNKRNGKVYLKAPKSNYIQWSIPKAVLNSDLVIYDHAKPIKKRMKSKNKKG